jgi:hypothetical protein
MVKKGDMQVQVLGTRFNVNAYENESNIKSDIAGRKRAGKRCAKQ